MKGGTVQINWHDVQPVLTLDFHSSTGILATGGNDHDIKLWVITPGESQKKLPTATYQNSLAYHSSAVNVLRFSPSGELLASGADGASSIPHTSDLSSCLIMASCEIIKVFLVKHRNTLVTLYSGNIVDEDDDNVIIALLGGELVLWKLHSADDNRSWKFLKVFIFHRKDVLDLQWSADGAYLVSGSVDNSCIIWDVNKGSVHQILDGHLHYVQGVTWDPLGHYVASLSSDRTCRVYANKPQSKHKGYEKVNYVCQHVLTKGELQTLDNQKSSSAKTHLFHDETLPSFFRRLQWSPDGSFLLVPAGTHKYSPTSETVNTAYIISRKDLARPAVLLPSASKPIVAVRFCPILFSLRGSKSGAGVFKLPYRVVFAVATLDSLYIYDTESLVPIAIFAGLHYAAITDIAWASNAKHLALSSRDGFCTILEFENDELGLPFLPSEPNKATGGSAEPTELKPEVVDNMEIDKVETPKTGETDTESGKAKQAAPTPTLKTDASKALKKRITPIAIT